MSLESFLLEITIILSWAVSAFLWYSNFQFHMQIKNQQRVINIQQARMAKLLKKSS